MDIKTQSLTWQQGHAWAADETTKLGCHETCEALGYDFDTPEYEHFMRGADFCQNERMGDAFGWEYLDNAD